MNKPTLALIPRTGDIVIDKYGIMYVVIQDETMHVYDKDGVTKFDGIVPDGTVACCRVKKDFNPDRRFMSVRTTKNVIGQFKVFLREKDSLTVLRSVGKESDTTEYRKVKMTFELTQNTMQKNTEYYERTNG